MYMKKSRKMQLLFFSLIPIGLVLLYLSINFAKKAFSGDILLEIPYTQKSGEFSINESGTYSIWHKGQFFRKAPLDEFKPEITNKSTGEKARLTSLLLRPNANNGLTARMELFRFEAPAGNYVLNLVKGSSISAIENNLLKLVPAPKVDSNNYFIQLRESRPLYQIIIGIVILTLSGLIIIGGLVFGILANQIFIK
jgi:hypothetical protein